MNDFILNWFKNYVTSDGKCNVKEIEDVFAITVTVYLQYLGVSVLILSLYLSGYRHTTISLICMSTHKATAASCLSYHQAASGQHTIQALATAPLRRLTLSMLFTISTTSYQITLYSLQEIFNKRQHANARHRVEFSHYDSTWLIDGTFYIPMVLF